MFREECELIILPHVPSKFIWPLGSCSPNTLWVRGVECSLSSLLVERRFPSCGCRDSWTPDLHSWGDLLERLTTHCGVEYSSLGRPHSKKTSTKWKNSKNKKKLEAASSAHSWNAGWRQTKLESEAQFCSQVKVVHGATRYCRSSNTAATTPTPLLVSASVVEDSAVWECAHNTVPIHAVCPFIIRIQGIQAELFGISAQGRSKIWNPNLSVLWWRKY